MFLYLFDYNNYYNRIVKGANNIEEYGEPLHIWQADFNPNDNVATQCVVNSYDGGRANYLVVCDDANVIQTRWFVTDSRRVRAGQYSLSLYRDVIYDYINDIVNAPCFIEKATLPLNSPFIFNNEGITFNQIKTQERPIKDKFGYPWIVGYIARNTDAQQITVPKNPIGVDYEFSSLGDYEYNRYRETDAVIDVGEPIIGLNYWYKTTSPILSYDRTYSFTYDTDGNPKRASYWNNYYFYDNIRYTDGAKGYRLSEQVIFNSLKATMDAAVKNVPWGDIYYPGYANIEEEPNIMEENGKVIKAGNDYYKIGVRQVGTRTKLVEAVSGTSIGILAKRVRDAVKDAGYSVFENAEEPSVMLEFSYPVYRVFYSPISVESIVINLPGQDNRAHAADSPYDIFAIPYGDYVLESAITGPRLTKEVSMRAAMALSNALGSNLYDLQLLPYTPLPIGSYANGGIFDTYWTGDAYTTHITEISNSETQAIEGTIYWLDNSSFQIEVGADVIIGKPSNALTAKIMNETKLYRICSPNYNGAFDINAAKNDGLSGFTAYCTYKPVSPYIQVAPKFNRLYGSNFDDARGLICGGDFSLPRISDAWVEYANNNKNYDIIFDRQFTNLEVNNNIAREQAQVQGAIGIATAAIQGATMGAMAGGAVKPGVGTGIGAGIGGVGMGIASAVGYAYDMEFINRSQTEAESYMKDMHGLQLGNIQAQPYSLTKVSAFNINNKIFPFLEVYEATQEEVQAFMEQLTYAGMTVNAMGTIATYQQETPTFIRGKLIRLEIDEDFHLVNTIANEIAKGVYI